MALAVPVLVVTVGLAGVPPEAGVATMVAKLLAAQGELKVIAVGVV